MNKKVEVENTPEQFAAQAILGMRGKVIGGSKGRYLHENESHMAIFNANVVTAENGKIWYGDLDLTLSYGRLQELASRIGRTVYILSEMDARFENELDPRVEEFVIMFTKAGDMTIRPSLNDQFYYLKDGVPMRYTEEEYKAKFVSSEPALSHYENDKDSFELFDMPDASEFDSRSKNSSPIDHLYKWFIDRYGSQEAASAVFEDIYWTLSYESAFNEILTNWCKNVRKWDDYETKKAVCWAAFDLPIGLGIDIDPTWAQPGAVYRRIKRPE